MTTYVYTHRDADDRVLYVGMTQDLSARKSQHKTSPWFNQAKFIAINKFSTREEASEHEKKLIELYDPEFNTCHKKKQPSVQFSVRLPEELHKAIKLDALEIGVSLEEYATLAFEDYLSKP